MILMYVILDQSILAIYSLEEFKDVVELASNSLFVEHSEPIYHMTKFIKLEKRIVVLDLDLWVSMHGSYNENRYEVTPELHKWLEVYKDESERAANEHCERLFISKPVAYRAIAPTGTIGILAGTTTGIEPLFAVAYKRRYLTDGTKWKYEYVVDSTADQLIKEYGLDPSKIDTAYGLSHDYEQRIKFQADIQDYVDMSISSTINLPSWGSQRKSANQMLRDLQKHFAKYAPRLRGFTVIQMEVEEVNP